MTPACPRSTACVLQVLCFQRQRSGFWTRKPSQTKPAGVTRQTQLAVGSVYSSIAAAWSTVYTAPASVPPVAAQVGLPVIHVQPAFFQPGCSCNLAAAQLLQQVSQGCCLEHPHLAHLLALGIGCCFAGLGVRVALTPSLSSSGGAATRCSGCVGGACKEGVGEHCWAAAACQPWHPGTPGFARGERFVAAAATQPHQLGSTGLSASKYLRCSW